jgi:redox-sensitive bicupin YhaK (pirin superfamily)
VRLGRAIGQPALPVLDPFLLLDRFHSADPADYVRGFPDHPHRGFETVTIMLDGRFRHRDSRGNAGVITGGGAQWMTAAGGIVHSEMPDQGEGLLSGFQLWVNLPAREKLSTPQYQDLPPAALASARLAGGSELRVVAGEVDGLRGPVRPRPTAPVLATLALADDRPFELDVPVDHTAFVFVHEGAVHVGAEDRATRVTDGTLAVLGPGRRVRLRARERRSGALIAAARPLGEPIARRGPFVMNTDAELAQAFADWRAGTLAR